MQSCLHHKMHHKTLPHLSQDLLEKEAGRLAESKDQGLCCETVSPSNIKTVPVKSHQLTA